MAKGSFKLEIRCGAKVTHKGFSTRMARYKAERKAVAKGCTTVSYCGKQGCRRK